MAYTAVPGESDEAGDEGGTAPTGRNLLVPPSDGAPGRHRRTKSQRIVVRPNSRITAVLASLLLAGTLLVYLFHRNLSLRQAKMTGKLEQPLQPTLKESNRVIAQPAKPVKGEGASPAYGRYINYYERKELAKYSEAGNASDQRAGQVWIIGDVHGMLAPLEKLIKKIEFDPLRDMCIIVGDLVAKGPHSLQVVHWARTMGCFTVRGNHDDKLIKWREWLVSVYGDRALTLEDGDEPVGAGAAPKYLGKWRSEHRRLAQTIDPEDYDWLVHAPVILHLPDFHTFVVHAGLLPGSYSRNSFEIAMESDTVGDEPLSTASDLIGSEDSEEDETLPLEVLQSHNGSVLATTESLLIVNSNPYIPMNMRSIYHGKATKQSGKGMHWGKVWEEAMRECLESTNLNETSSHRCKVDRIVYGHAAGRGLDLRKWTQGLDSACVYGGQLTALALPSPELITQSLYDLESRVRHRIAQVDCKM